MSYCGLFMAVQYVLLPGWHACGMHDQVKGKLLPQRCPDSGVSTVGRTTCIDGTLAARMCSNWGCIE